MRPEQARAMEYLRRKGTEAPPAVIRERVAKTFADLENLLEGIGEEVARTWPVPGRWCVQEVTDHLIVSLSPGVDQLRALLAGESPREAIPAHLQSPDPLARPWPEVRAELAAVHARFLAVLETAGEETPLTARAPFAMVIKAEAAEGATETLEWTEEIDWKAYAVVARVHALEHMAQVQRTLAALSP